MSEHRINVYMSREQLYEWEQAARSFGILNPNLKRQQIGNVSGILRHVADALARKPEDATRLLASILSLSDED